MFVVPEFRFVWGLQEPKAPRVGPLRLRNTEAPKRRQFEPEDWKDQGSAASIARAPRHWIGSRVVTGDLWVLFKGNIGSLQLCYFQMSRSYNNLLHMRWWRSILRRNRDPKKAIRFMPPAQAGEQLRYTT